MHHPHSPRRLAWSSHRLSAWSSRTRIASCPRRKASSRRGSGLSLASHLAIVLAEERQLQAVARLGVVAIGLRFAEVMPRQAVVVGHDLPLRLRAEQLFLQEDARPRAI